MKPQGWYVHVILTLCYMYLPQIIKITASFSNFSILVKSAACRCMLHVAKPLVAQTYVQLRLSLNTSYEIPYFTVYVMQL